MTNPCSWMITAFSSNFRTCKTCKAGKGKDKGGNRTLKAIEASGHNRGCRRCLIIVKGVRAFVAEQNPFPSSEWEDELRICVPSNPVDDLLLSPFGRRGKSYVYLEFYVNAAATYLNKTQFTIPRIPKFHHYNHIEAIGTPAPCLRFALQSLQSCTESHSCYAHSNSVPKRLIDVATGFDLNSVYVVKSASTSSSRSIRYAALSYCWGVKSTTQSEVLSMKESDFCSHRTELKLSALPMVFQDAVRTTRALGIDYLWVDALCIAQGDPQEWIEESAKMAEYYSNAFVTIAATAAASAEESFLDVDCYRKTRKATEVLVCEAFCLQRRVFVREKLDWQDLRRTIDERSWTLQESLLSKRILMFQQSRVVFSCLKGVISEDGLPLCDNTDEDGDDKRFPRHLSLYPAVHEWRNELHPKQLLTPKELWRVWQKVLQHYGPRKLTCPDDSLVAISGVASQLSRCAQPGNPYLAGLWKQNFIEELLWKSTLGRNSQRGPILRLEVPSWSWGSVSGVRKDWLSHDSSRYYSILVSARLMKAPGGVFGQVKAAEVVLEGPSLRGMMRNGELYLVLVGPIEVREFDRFDITTVQAGDGSFLATYPRSAQILPDIPWEQLGAPWVSDEVRETLDTESQANIPKGDMANVDLLLLVWQPSSHDYSYYGFPQTVFLMLAPTGAGEGQYRRLGLWRCWNNPTWSDKGFPKRLDKWQKGLPRKRFTVV